MRKIRRAVLLAVLALGLIGVGATPASARATQVSGTAVLDPGGVCPAPVAPFNDYPALVMEGSLQGCWYTDISWSKLFPNGFYLEVGQETFVGTVDGKAVTFTTKYVFEAKLDAEGFEVSGQCQHLIVRKDGQQGISGLILFTDIVDQATHEVTYEYKGVVS